MAEVLDKSLAGAFGGPAKILFLLLYRSTNLMRIAYFDCYCGISAEKILGAFIDCGLSIAELQAEIDKLKFAGCKIKAEPAKRGAIFGTEFSIESEEPKKEHKFKDVLNLIEASALELKIKELSKTAYEHLAEAEARIHNESIDKIHFHEVGRLASIAKITGVFCAIRLMGIERIFASAIQVGRGFVECQHGILPVPCPVSLALLKGIPIYSNDIEAELVTHSGACSLKTVVKDFGPIPKMKIETLGYGAGKKELLIPNFLRVYIGELC